MGKYFKEFCESIHKTEAGHVPDLLDLENDDLRDLAMACFLEDKLGSGSGSRYMNAISNKTTINDIYAKHETECQGAIDHYNYGVDLEKELDGDIPLTNGERACVLIAQTTTI